MKFVKLFSMRVATVTVALRCAILIIGIVLTACGGTQKKPSGLADAAPELIPTKQYLPVRQYDKEGNVVPFERRPNPYASLRSKVDREAIVYYIDARKAFNSAHFTKAESLLKKVIAEDDDLAGPWVMRGNIAENQKKYDDAIKHYQKAIATNKLNINAYLPLARLQRVRGDFIQAQNTYADALKIWPHFPEAHLNLAILYDIYLNDPLQAQQHMEAYLFLKQGDDAKAVAWLKEIQARTGVANNLYIGSSSASQNRETKGEKPDA